MHAYSRHPIQPGNHSASLSKLGIGCLVYTCKQAIIIRLHASNVHVYVVDSDLCCV